MSENNITDAERNKLFGKPSFRQIGGGQVALDPDWVRENLVRVHVPQLVGLPTDGGVCSGNITWHVKAVEQLLKAWREVEALGYLGDILSWDGSWNPRFKRGSTTSLSNHALASAFDVNCEWNQYNGQTAKDGQRGSLRRVAPVFKTHGFGWGGDWEKPRDGMHFEVVRIINYSPQEHPAGPSKRPMLVLNDDATHPLDLELEDGRAFVSAKALTEAAGEKWDGPDVRAPAGHLLDTLGYWFKFNSDQKKLYAYKKG